MLWMRGYLALSGWKEWIVRGCEFCIIQFPYPGPPSERDEHQHSAVLYNTAKSPGHSNHSRCSIKRSSEDT